METRLVQCAVCGAELDLMTNQCPYCVPDAPPVEVAAALPALVPVAPPPASATVLAPAPPPAPAPAPAAQPEPEPARPVTALAPAPTPAEAPTSAPAASTLDDRALGLVLFEAEESLARGAPEKALVLASKAVKDRPESLTARALLERARRELLRGKRREKLETRVKEAEELLERGDTAAAEKIVGSALKLLPDHPGALALFARLRDRKLSAGTVEAEAEMELQKMARAQAHQALRAARAAIESGWGRRAALALRRGLRLAPDDPELLALLKQVQSSTEELEEDRGRRRALLAQVRAGLELLALGRLDESEKILSAVLREDPENTRAREALDKLRLTRTPTAVLEPQPLLIDPPQDSEPEMAIEKAAAPPPTPRSAPLEPSRPVAPAPRIEAPAPVRASEPPRAAPAPSPRPAAARTSAPNPAVPGEILLPRTVRRSTPIGLVLAGGAALSVAVFVIAGRSGGPPHPSASEPPSTAPAAPAPRVATPPTVEQAEGPLRDVSIELKRAIQSTLAAYAHALEVGDAALLEKARPDMTDAERSLRLAPFAGALNATTDIRVLQVEITGDEATVEILCTDVIVGGKSQSGPPTNEILRFASSPDGWALRARGGAAGGPGKH
jgi:tetratricopeptide (TPR) repeat protein